MKLKFLPALYIYMGSYLPLSIILLVRDFDIKKYSEKICFPVESNCYFPLKNPEISILAAFLCLVCFFLSYRFLCGVSCNHSLEVLRSKHVPSDMLSYIVPYIVSFSSLSYSSGVEVVSFLLAFFFLFLLAQYTGRVMLNPVLAIFKWKLYEVDYKHGAGGRHVTRTVLSRVVPDAGEYHNFCRIQDLVIIK